MKEKNINIADILYEVCEDDSVYNPDFDLIESDVLDSLAFIEFLSKLEDLGIVIQPTRINRKLLRTPRTIEKMINDYLKNNN